MRRSSSEHGDVTTLHTQAKKLSGTPGSLHYGRQIARSREQLTKQHVSEGEPPVRRESSWLSVHGRNETGRESLMNLSSFVVAERRAVCPRGFLVTVDANKAIVRRVFDELFNRGETDAIDSIYAVDYLNPSAPVGFPRGAAMRPENRSVSFAPPSPISASQLRT